MIGFEYYNPAKIVFGEDSEKKLKGLLEAYKVKSLLLVYSGDFIKDLGIYQVVSDAAKELGIRFSENGEVVPNPSQDPKQDQHQPTFGVLVHLRAPFRTRRGFSTGSLYWADRNL